MATPASNTIFRVNDNRESGWDQIELRDPVLISLTEVFGAGREPTAEYMDALLAKHDHYIGGVDQFAIGDALQTLAVAGPGMTLRHDTSVGTRVFLDHPGGTTMLYGDTGWRDITTLLPTGVTPSSNLGEARIKRINDRVYVELKVDIGDTYTGPEILVVPRGFDPAGYRYLSVPFGADGLGQPASAHIPFPYIGYARYVYAGSPVQTPAAHPFSKNSTVIWTFDYDCPWPWPNTLPGTPL